MELMSLSWKLVGSNVYTSIRYLGSASQPTIVAASDTGQTIRCCCLLMVVACFFAPENPRTDGRFATVSFCDLHPETVRRAEHPSPDLGMHFRKDCQNWFGRGHIPHLSNLLACLAFTAVRQSS